LAAFSILSDFIPYSYCKLRINIGRICMGIKNWDSFNLYNLIYVADAFLDFLN
jgi:hypothetical protein